MTTQAVDEEELLVHNWRWHGSPSSASPGRWPRSKPAASTGTRSPGWSNEDEAQQQEDLRKVAEKEAEAVPDWPPGP